MFVYLHVCVAIMFRRTGTHTDCNAYGIIRITVASVRTAQ
jgi:hypothetical protein